jgi:hypothetical protein
MRSETAEGAVMSYTLGLLCECGARRSDNSRRLCAQCRYSKASWEINSVEQSASAPRPRGRRSSAALSLSKGPAGGLLCKATPALVLSVVTCETWRE